MPAQRCSSILALPNDFFSGSENFPAPRSLYSQTNTFLYEETLLFLLKLLPIAFLRAQHGSLRLQHILFIGDGNRYIRRTKGVLRRTWCSRTTTCFPLLFFVSSDQRLMNAVRAHIIVQTGNSVSTLWGRLIAFASQGLFSPTSQRNAKVRKTFKASCFGFLTLKRQAETGSQAGQPLDITFDWPNLNTSFFLSSFSKNITSMWCQLRTFETWSSVLMLLEPLHHCATAYCSSVILSVRRNWGMTPLSYRYLGNARQQFIFSHLAANTSSPPTNHLTVHDDRPNQTIHLTVHTSSQPN